MAIRIEHISKHFWEAEAHLSYYMRCIVSARTPKVCVCVCVCVCSPDLEVCSVGPEHVTVQRFPHFVYRRLPPASGVVTERTVLTGSRKQETL